MKQYIVFDPEKCVACHACSVACIDQNDTDVGAGDEAFRKAYNIELRDPMGGYRFAFLSTACRHCQDAPCVKACPVGCIKKDNATGMTVYDNTNCIGCRSCGMACPYGAPRYRVSDGKMAKCDGCYVRIENGLKPACVMACAFGALTLMSEEEYKKAEDKKAVDAMVRVIGGTK